MKELERIYGIEHGGDRKSSTNNSVLKSQFDLASQMGMPVDTLQNYKMSADMITELDSPKRGNQVYVKGLLATLILLNW